MCINFQGGATKMANYLTYMAAVKSKKKSIEGGKEKTEETQMSILTEQNYTIVEPCERNPGEEHIDEDWSKPCS